MKNILKFSVLLLALNFLAPALQAIELDQFKVLAHQLELRAAILNRDMQMMLGGNPYAKYFLQFVEEFAIGCTKLHKLSDQWYVTGTGLGARMDSLEYLAQQIQFAAAHTQADMSEYYRQWKDIKEIYRQLIQVYRGQHPNYVPNAGGQPGSLSPYNPAGGNGGVFNPNKPPLGAPVTNPMPVTPGTQLPTPPAP